MDTIFLIALSIAPGIYLIYRYYSKDIYKKEPWIVIWKSFFWGAAVVIPAGFLETIIEVPEKDKLVGMILENFFVIALTEELCKFLVIRLYSYRILHFDETMDGIVYGVAVASGFATFENIFYVMENGFTVAMIRAFLSVPSHIFEGAILGYWLAKSKFQNVSPVYATAVSLLIVVSAHGFFDFILSYNNAEFFYLSLIPVLLLGWLVKIYVKDALQYDLEHIHKTPQVIVQSESIAFATETEEVFISKTETISSSINPLKKLIYLSLYFLSIVCFLTAAFLGLGFASLLLEGKEELWTLVLPAAPFILGIYFVYKGRKLKMESRKPDLKSGF